MSQVRDAYCFTREAITCSKCTTSAVRLLTRNFPVTRSLSLFLSRPRIINEPQCHCLLYYLPRSSLLQRSFTCVCSPKIIFVQLAHLIADCAIFSSSNRYRYRLRYRHRFIRSLLCFLHTSLYLNVTDDRSSPAVRRRSSYLLLFLCRTLCHCCLIS